jgi:arylsulfatase A-like enzyme
LNGDIDRPLFGKPVSEQENINYNLKKIGEIGTPAATEGNYPLGWAQAADTPFKFWKQDANSEGGTHNPLIVYWPKGIKDKGGIRTQYSHVIDLLPTTLDLVGIKAPEEIRGIKQQPIEGTSWPTRLTMPRRPPATRCSITTSLARGRSTTTDGRLNWLTQAALSQETCSQPHSL